MNDMTTLILWPRQMLLISDIFISGGSDEPGPVAYPSLPLLDLLLLSNSQTTELVKPSIHTLKPAS